MVFIKCIVHVTFRFAGHRLIFKSKENKYTLKGDNSFKVVSLCKKRSVLKRKKFTPKGANSFLLEQTPFQKAVYIYILRKHAYLIIKKIPPPKTEKFSDKKL